MKAELFLEAMNELPDDLLAEERTAQRVRPRRRYLRTALLAAALAMLLSVTAYAAGGSLAGIQNSSKLGCRWSSLTKLPKAERLLGREAIVPERFENGFAFKTLGISYSQRTDDAGDVVETWPELWASYENGGHTVRLGVTADRGEPFDASWIMREYEGAEIWSYGVIYKVVPEGYLASDEDLRKQEDGEMMLTWGSEEIEYYPSSFACFTLDGTAYTLLNMDGVREDELVMMAEEILTARAEKR